MENGLRPKKNGSRTRRRRGSAPCWCSPAAATVRPPPRPRTTPAAPPPTHTAPATARAARPRSLIRRGRPPPRVRCGRRMAKCRGPVAALTRQRTTCDAPTAITARATPRGWHSTSDGCTLMCVPGCKPSARASGRAAERAVCARAHAICACHSRASSYAQLLQRRQAFKCPQRDRRDLVVVETPAKGASESKARTNA